MSKKKRILASKNMTVIEMASLGGKARAVKLSAERRREIASNAIKARWAKQKKMRMRVPSNEPS